MNLNLQITFTDKTEKLVTAVAPDFIAFEREFSISVIELEKKVMITHLFFLAWHVEKRTKETAKSFDEWVETVSSVEASAGKK